MLSGFRQFILRGNVVDLAVGVVMGAAFGAVVSALVKDLLTPVIAALVRKPDFSGFFLEVNSSKLMYGDFLNALVSFLLIAFAVYFFVVVPMNAFLARMKPAEKPTAPTTAPCPECLSQIPIGARRCAFCTAEVKAMAAGS
jgi:large conductance mechanosensitive channel